VKPIEIDDVPIVNVALFSDRYDTHDLYRIAEESVSKLQHIPNSARITIHGGERRVVHVALNTERLAAYGLSTMEIMQALQAGNAQLDSGTYAQADQTIRVKAGPSSAT
jgi:multidrug efflux pump subunit AcrB